MRDQGTRLVHDPQPAPSQAHTQVDIFVVGGRVALVQAAEGVESGPSDQQAGRGAGVDEASEAVAEPLRIVAVSVDEDRPVLGQQHPAS